MKKLTVKETKRLEGAFFVYGFDSTIPEFECDFHRKLGLLLDRVARDIEVVHNGKFVRKLEKLYNFLESIYYQLNSAVITGSKCELIDAVAEAKRYQLPDLQ